jgi:DNA-binding MarR family transcriptional regulator/predicted GNAT family acetyltransferase
MDHVAAIRAFNRFYAPVIGLLGDGLAHTPFNLTEARVLYELAQRGSAESADLRAHLGLDAGYLSRILGRFEEAGIVAREKAENDARRQIVSLTDAGRAAFEVLDERTAASIRDLLSPLSTREQDQVVAAMDRIRSLLGPRRVRTVELREPGPGDLGWVVARHGALYAEKYGWDVRFEALVAQVVAEFAAGHDPKRERAWIATIDGAPVGSVFCVRMDDHTAKLRLLFVDPGARGAGVGGKLVRSCIAFAMEAGYDTLALWTNDVLHAARRIYEREGFELVEEAPHDEFGEGLVGQVWAKRLRSP